MNRRLAARLFGLSACCVVTAALAEEIESLRGHAVTDVSGQTPNKPMLAVPGGFEVNWEKQPPLIPHPIDHYSIDLRQNGCLKCHSPATFETAKAPVITESHFYDRDGNKLDGLAPRRYFCTLCHAPQAGAMPLVENVFKGR